MDNDRGGAIFVWDWNGTVWNRHQQIGQTSYSYISPESVLVEPTGSDIFANGGIKISSDGNRIVVGSNQAVSNQPVNGRISYSGYITTLDYTPSGATSWTAVGGYFYSDNINYNQFGRLIDLSDDGKTLVAHNSRPSDTGGSDNGGDIAGIYLELLEHQLGQ